MLPLDEPEILNGTRAWPETQAEFVGAPDPNRKRYAIESSWYDTTTNQHEGAFCMVQSGSEMEELIGDIVQVVYKNKQIYVYCVGSADLSADFALARTAFFNIELLSSDDILVGVQPTVRA